MAKKPEATEPQSNSVPAIVAAPMEVSLAMKQGDTNGALAALANVPQANFLNLSGEYRKFIPGETVNLCINGMGTMENTINPDGPDVETVEFTMITNEEIGATEDFVNSDVVFLSAIKKALEKGARYPFGVRVVVGQKEQAQNSQFSYLRMKVGLLPQGPVMQEQGAGTLTPVTEAEVIS